MAVGASGEIRQPRSRHIRTCLVRISLEEYLVDELGVRVVLTPQLFSLLLDKRSDRFRIGHSFSFGQIFVVTGHRAKEPKYGSRIAVRQCQIGIVEIELELMAGLTIRFERNALHETAFDFQLVAIVAIKFLSRLVNGGDIRAEMAAMIESQNVAWSICGQI